MTDVKYRLVKQIAESLLEAYPDSAHLHALEKLNNIGSPSVVPADMWRQVLIELDKIQGEKNDCKQRLDE
jgi:hypothetical protein